MTNDAYEMDDFSSAELEGMRTTQESAMMDVVTRLVWSVETDALNANVPTWTAGIRIPCGIDMTGGREARDGGRFVVNWDARLRLPLGTTLDLRDRLQISVRFGQPVTNGTIYEIIAPFEEGPSGLQVSVQKVEPSE